MRHVPRFARAIAVGAALAAISLVQPARAGIEYHALDRTLSDLVDDLSQMLHVPMSVSRADSIRVKDWSVKGNAATVAEELARNFALVYYFDGSGYLFVPSADLRPRSFLVDPARMARTTAVLRSLYPRTSRDAIHVDRANGVITVRASERIVSEAEAAIKNALAAPIPDDKTILFIRAGVPDDAPRPAK